MQHRRSGTRRWRRCRHPSRRRLVGTRRPPASPHRPGRHRSARSQHAPNATHLASSRTGPQPTTAAPAGPRDSEGERRSRRPRSRRTPRPPAPSHLPARHPGRDLGTRRFWGVFALSMCSRAGATPDSHARPPTDVTRSTTEPTRPTRPVCARTGKQIERAKRRRSAGHRLGCRFGRARPWPRSGCDFAQLAYPPRAIGGVPPRGTDWRDYRPSC